MKIEVVKSQLVAGLALVKDACEGKDGLNILRCIRLVATGGEDGGRVTIEATNLSVSVTASVPCETVEPGEAAVVGSFLFGFANALPEGKIEIALGPGAAKASIVGGSCRYALAAGDVSQWPRMADVGRDEGGRERPVTKYAIKAATLREIFRKTKYAASVNVTRRVLCGVNLETKDGTLTAVATDGRRLSCVEIPVETDGASSCTITVKTIQQVEKAIGKGEGDVTVETDGAQMKFTDGEGAWTVRTKLIADVYPNWRQVVPRERTNVATMDREILLAEIGRVALSSQEIGLDRCVELALSGGALGISADRSEVSSAKTELPVKYDGTDVSVHVNPDLVRDILHSVDEDEVEIAFGNGSTPLTFRTAAPFVAVLMPLRV